MFLPTKTEGNPLLLQKTSLHDTTANPYRAALALLYLDAYLGNNSVANAIKSLPKNSQIDRALKQDLATTTTKPIDWFFEHYIKLDNNIDLSVSANKIKDDSYALTLESTQKNIAIPLSITTQDGKQNTIWIADGELNNTQVVHGKDTASLTLNKDHYIPELSLNNNTYNFNRKIFRNNLRPRLLQDIPQSGTSVVLLSPEFRYNVYDGLLAGITVGNSSLLSNNFGFKFSPQYGTKSGQTNGLAYVVGNLYHDKKSHYLTRITVFGSSYNYAANKRYSTFTPSVQFYFRPNGIQQKDRSYFLLRHISVRLQDLPKNDSRRSYGVSLATFQSKSGDALQNIFYRTELQIANAFKKLSAESEYITYYLPNRRLTLRLFAGGFLHNTTNDSYYDFNASRVNDYLFQYDLYGRSENDGFFSQQYIKAEGALRTTGNVSGANKWMLTAQTTTTLWRWIEAYAEVGWLKNSNQKTQTHWGTEYGAVLSALFWGIVPAWFWATYQKLKQGQSVSQIEGVASYAIVLFGGILALFGILCVFASIGLMIAEPEIIQAAIEQQPNYDDLSDEDLENITKVMELLPSLMPIITLGVCLQSVAYIGYGLAVVRTYSR